MSKTDVIQLEGKVIEKLPNAMFQVELENELYPHTPGRPGDGGIIPL